MFVMPGFSRPVRVEPDAALDGGKRWSAAPGCPAAALEAAGRVRRASSGDREWRALLEAREMQVLPRTRPCPWGGGGDRIENRLHSLCGEIPGSSSCSRGIGCHSRGECWLPPPLHQQTVCRG